MTNIVLILADDLGYSDIGCYGGEISTPNLDRLAADGIRMTQFYNTARCSPSRASLLTGLHPHQTGIGILTNDERPTGYPGTLHDRCRTIAESLGEHGWATGLSGKWHLTNSVHEPDGAWPTQRGFDHFFGTLTGCGSYYDPGTLTRETAPAPDATSDPAFFYTDAITDDAVGFVASRARSEQPFFLYAAYTAPHWPLHAPEEDIAAYDGVFDDGWDTLRERRLARMVELGVAPPGTRLSDRDPTQPAWADEPRQKWQTRRMQTYAAQVERMDAGIGRILDELQAQDALEDTLVVFLADNGASPEDLPQGDPDRFATRADILSTHTRDGRPVRIGNDPDVDPGAEDTYASYGRAWANLSNAPYRYYKKWVHEGGIASPLIAHWPAGGLAAGGVVDTPAQLVDVVPTLHEITATAYPSTTERPELPRLPGRSLLDAWRGAPGTDERTLYWEHCGNAALRSADWKLVREWPGEWELYDLATDRTELRDLASDEPRVAADLAARWHRWAEQIGLVPFETTVRHYQELGVSRGRAEAIAASEDYL